MGQDYVHLTPKAVFIKTLSFLCKGSSFNRSRTGKWKESAGWAENIDSAGGRAFSLELGQPGAASGQE